MQKHSVPKWIPLIVCITMALFAIGIYSILNPFFQFLLFALLCLSVACLGLLLYRHTTSPIKITNTDDNEQAVILLVDDNRANRRIISEILTPFPITLSEASSGQEAIYLYKQQRFEVILMDIELQDMNGMEVAHFIRQQEENKTRLPIIAISAHSDVDHKIKALTAGFDDYVTKPVDKESLLNSLSRWAQNKALIDALKKISLSPIPSSSGFESYTENNSYEDQCDTAVSPEDIDTLSEQNANIAYGNEKPTDSTRTTKKIVDVKLSLKYSNHNYGLAKDMLELLLALVKEKRVLAPALYQEKNWPELAALAHKINGGSCYCGVPELQKQAQKLEKALEKNETQLIKLHYPLFIDAIDNLLKWEEEHDIAIIFDQ